MRQPVARALALATVLLLAGPAVTEQPVQLYPCLTLGRSGTVDVSGSVTRPNTPRQLAANMVRNCDYVLLGRFVSVSDSHYDRLTGPAEEPVVATFRVAEVLRGDAVAIATIGLARSMLIAPGKDVSRLISPVEDDRLGLAMDLEDELRAIRDSGMPLTAAQHERIVARVREMVRVPPRTRYERHLMAESVVATSSPLFFESELGAIHPDQLYLLGLIDEKPEWPRGRYFSSVHTDLFWGQEAWDIGARVGEQPENARAP